MHGSLSKMLALGKSTRKDKQDNSLVLTHFAQTQKAVLTDARVVGEESIKQILRGHKFINEDGVLQDLSITKALQITFTLL